MITVSISHRFFLCQSVTNCFKSCFSTFFVNFKSLVQRSNYFKTFFYIFSKLDLSSALNNFFQRKPQNLKHFRHQQSYNLLFPDTSSHFINPITVINLRNLDHKPPIIFHDYFPANGHAFSTVNETLSACPLSLRVWPSHIIITHIFLIISIPCVTLL